MEIRISSSFYQFIGKVIGTAAPSGVPVSMSTNIADLIVMEIVPLRNIAIVGAVCAGAGRMARGIGMKDDVGEGM